MTKTKIADNLLGGYGAMRFFRSYQQSSFLL